MPSTEQGLNLMPGPSLFLKAHEAPHGVDYENEARARGFWWVAGVDEVGRGPLAGPVVAAAVVFEKDTFSDEVKDSKLLTARRREALCGWIKENAHAWAVGMAEPEEIDRLNILAASLVAMSRAVKGLSRMPDFLLIDGPHPIPSSNFTDGAGSWTGVPRQRAIKQGDKVCFSIAAASIVAKVARDEMMVELDALYPEYGFAKHKGYRSASHAEALRVHGPCPIHRRSFKPVAEACQDQGLLGPLFDATNSHGEP